LGIPSLNIGFGGESAGGIYHSNYDSYDYYVRFGDPDFQYVMATAQLGGRMMLRLANAEWLPLRVEATSLAVRGWMNEVIKLSDDMRTQTRRQNELIRSGALKLAADPRKTYVVPEPESEVPFLNFAPLQNAVARLEQATAAIGKLDPAKLSPAKRQALDDSLRLAERKFLRNDGLPRRPWFRHVLQAPGYYTGYGVKTLPGVREAIEQRLWKEADQQIGFTAEALVVYAKWLEDAAAGQQ